ncbi:FAD-dependent monooxygenase [Pseudonocardia sp.]|uniref:FAD-dependent monooxygenase n=1 Tax=Pseudonocardia sp. TaxID=60912 RepID=UPI003D142A64
MSDTDVCIVGAGPTGLLLAGDLATAGLRVTLLERRSEDSTLTRAFVVHARTLEQLDARGLADALLARGRRADRFRVFGQVAVDLSSLPGRYPFMLVTPQYEVERALLDRAVRAGATVVRGAEVTGLQQDADGVEVTCADGSRVRAAYAVGTDGHHSAVRRALGLPFPGRAAARSLMLADVRMTDPPADQLTVNGKEHGFCFVVPFGDGWYRVIARDRRRELPDDAPVTLDEIAAVARHVFGTDFGMHDPRWMSRFHSDERQAPHYRVARVFLAGDAAHVHSPAGGMGMNTGLQDAANLSWRLAAAVRGVADPDALLDGYERERHPVGRLVLRMSGGLLRAAMLRSAPARALRDALVPRLLAVPPIGRRMRMLQSGIGIAYPRPRGAHRLVGTRAPDVVGTRTGTGGTRLYEALRAGRFVLVAPAGFAGPVTLAAPVTPMLVRPDGYIAWAGETPEGLDAALAAHGAVLDGLLDAGSTVCSTAHPAA